MKIAILSDFHLGYERFREDAFRQAEEALKKAAEIADAIIIPGDIFDNRSPKPDVIAEAINLFRDLSVREWEAKVVGFEGDGKNYCKAPIIAIPGTHERRAQDAADPIDILGLAGMVVDISNATAIVQKDGERVAVRGIGGIADDRFREIVEKERPAPVDGAFNIFMFHESLYELLPFSQGFMHIDELPLGFDLYVNGHIHNNVEMDVHGKKLLIPGSTVLTQLKTGEQGQKGFYVFDTRSEAYEFIRIGSRRFVVSKIDAGSAGNGRLAEEVCREIERAIGNGSDMPIVRIVIDGKLPKGQNAEIDINDISRRYKDRAIIEVSKSGITEEMVREGTASQAVQFDRMSVKDYGLGIFLEKVKQAGITTGDISPAELLEILGSEQNREKAVKKALDELIE